ncbi:proline--tRNA ligase [Fluviispira multicolorata]|uniref:Proline--tRNA ligase n=1 Tax=Fluviispira multicolorata TaxID=2654512 RepID=A0A833JBL1_9BACT|nr:proline--tRNA ligase [Fluviispira multicolorata]KAB8028614.1 proline--tRNA ligase [Fluviispira multicolorata]
MRMSRLVGKTVKESPRDAEIPSHKLMLRAGYMRQYSAGIYGLLPLAMRSISKIEKICREEMNGIEGQEIRMPCSATKELWDETGRYQTFGKDMLKFHDRNEKPMVLNPTHEEPVVYLTRTELTSYRQLPLMMYQIQTKFRDEPRPRGGLVRLREFTMKDAYSFHATEEDLKEYYDKVHAAYIRFYKRTGCKNFVSVMSDNGVFGGRYSHEFQMLVPTGEDKLITCSHCKISSNEEIATSSFVIKKSSENKLEKTHTPNQKTIEGLSKFLNISPEQTAKAVIFQTLSGTPVVSFVRGDLEVINAKVRNLVKSEVIPATHENLVKAGAVAGSTGPIGLNLHNCYVVLDHTVVKSSNLATGANEKDYHFINFNAERDFLSTLKEFEKTKVIVGDIAAVRAGDPCSICSNPLQETRGIEIGNIFHLGTKYTKDMECTYLDQSGKKQYPIMGCYGIGITRLLPAIIEESHDERGPILPLPIAPYEIHLCSLNRKDIQVTELSEKIYDNLSKLGFEVLFDDRDEKPGSQFADADLIGVPYRVIISPKTLAEGCAELKYRDNRLEPRKIKIEEIVDILKSEITAEYSKYKNV